MATESAAAASSDVTAFMDSRLEKVRSNSSRFPLTVAISRTPTTVMPNIENMMQKSTTVSTKLQMPMFDTPSTLDTYGYVIRGKM